jgi:hypothetical protein
MHPAAFSDIIMSRCETVGRNNIALKMADNYLTHISPRVVKRHSDSGPEKIVSDEFKEWNRK